jgi:Gpi18-like mannosyltransferase
VKHRWAFLIILSVIALGLRFVLSLSWVEVADTANYRLVAETLAAGGHLYRDTPGIYPYPPVWSVFERVALFLSQNILLPFHFWIEIPGMLADIGISMILCKIGKSSLLFASLYLFNPIAIAISSMHGQFDSIPVFFLLLACFIFHNLGRPFIARASLAAGIAMKSFPVMLLPFFLIQIPTTRKRIIALAIAAGPVIALLLPFYLADGKALARQLFG